MTIEAGQKMTVADLIEHVEKTYHCMMGPPRAYFELPLEGLKLDARFVYESINIIDQRTGPEIEDRLCRTLKAMFPLVEDSKGLCLFWRREPKIEIFTDRDRTKISTRLVIPGYRLSSNRFTEVLS